jgi:Spy/CpxP family protein refolding chaperone
MRSGRGGIGMILNFKEELKLTDDQVARLEKIRSEHTVYMQERSEELRELRTSMRDARTAEDWDALEKAIEENAKLRGEMAKSRLRVTRDSQDALTAEQKSTLDTWRQGYQLFNRQRMRGRRQDAVDRGTGRGIMRRQRLHQPPDSASSSN